MLEIVSRKEARDSGLKRYYTGKPCRSGHVSDRFTATADCTECNREKNRVGDCSLRRLKKREKNLQERYGISLTDYMNLLTAQDNRCASCGNLEKELIVDHDHSHDTGKVRGLICHRCNNIIGFAKDNPHVLQCAIDYLLKTA